MKSNNDKIDNINNKMVKSKVMSVNIKEQDGTMLNASSSVLSPKWALVKETFINNKKLSALKTFAKNKDELRKGLIEKQQSLLLNMIKVKHKPVTVHVEPVQMGARRNSTSKIMMIDEQRHFHKKGIEETTSAVDTKAPKAFRYSVYKSVSRVLENKFRYPTVGLPNAIKNHMNRAELQQYTINQKHYKRHIKKSKAYVNTYNPRKKQANNFESLMYSLNVTSNRKNDKFSKQKYNKRRGNTQRPITAPMMRNYKTTAGRNRPSTANNFKKGNTRRNYIPTRSVTALPRVHHENSSNFQQSALKFKVFMKGNVDDTGDGRRASTDKKYRTYSI